jgi:acetyl-CoA acetyltransferase
MTMRDVHVIGVGLHPATQAETALRLEEMVFETSRRALSDASVTRRQLDSVVLAASDELDGRPISSMLMTGPAGGYMTNEIKVTDSGLTALCLAYARIRAGECDLGLVASWCKSSKTSMDGVMRYRSDPFYLRPLDFTSAIADGLFAQAMQHEHRVTVAEATERAHRASIRAAANDRGMRRRPADIAAVAASNYLATPVREGHVAPLTDGAASIVVASSSFLAANPQCRSLARITGVGWTTDSYQLGAERLSGLNAARRAWGQAVGMAGLSSAADLDVLELDSPTSWHEAGWVRAFGIEREETISPSGGTSAQNPFFCAGLVNAVEAVLQVSGRAGPVQMANAKRAAAHGCHGFAQQGNSVVVFEGGEARK